MALPPTGSGPRDLRERAGLPPSSRPASRVPGTKAPAAPPAAKAPATGSPDAETTARSPQPGRRIRTATTDAEVERQIKRLMVLIANDNIDPNAPPGSYLNMLI